MPVNNEILQAFCRTLAHSLWQGIVLAVLTGVVVIMTRRTSASLRYNLLTFLGLTFIASTALTFYIQLQHKPVTSPISEHLGSSQAFSPVLVTYVQPVLHQARSANADGQAQTVIGSVTGFLDKHATVIFALWFVVFLFKSLHLVGGLRQIHFLRHHHVSPAPGHWSGRLNALKAKLGIRYPVLLLESSLVKTPAMAGFFKPVILVPVGLLANIPMAEAEAILLHELAHIRRKDYLVNMIQGFGEVVFFFNPGFLWLSSLIKTERENCCDDMALAVMESKIELVNALVSSQEYASHENRLVLGFGRKHSPLLDRAKRILYNRNQSLSNMEKKFLSICVVAGLFLVFSFTGTKQPEKPAALPDKPKPHHAPEPLPSNIVYADRKYNPGDYAEGTAIRYVDRINGHAQNTYLFKHQGVLYQVSGDVRLLKVNGKTIPREHWGRYLPVVEPLIAAYRRNHLNNSLAPVPDSLDELDVPAPPTPPAPPSPPVPPAPPAPLSAGRSNYTSLFHHLNSIQDDSLRDKKLKEAQRKLEMEMKKMEEQLEKAEIEIRQAEKEMRNADDEMRKAELEMRKAELEMEKANREMARADLEMQRAHHEMEKAHRHASRHSFDEVHTAVLNDLKNELGTEITSYKLSDKELVVNGKKQSNDLHQRMNNKYLKEKKITNLYYRYNTSRGKGKTLITGIEIND